MCDAHIWTLRSERPGSEDEEKVVKQTEMTPCGEVMTNDAKPTVAVEGQTQPQTRRPLRTGRATSQDKREEGRRLLATGSADAETEQEDGNSTGWDCDGSDWKLGGSERTRKPEPGA